MPPAIEVRDGEVVVGERILQAGDVITIDGGTGEVFEGAVPGTTEVVPEARTLLAWARGARDPDRATATRPRRGRPRRSVPDDRAQGHARRLPAGARDQGLRPGQGVADAVLSTPDEVAADPRPAGRRRARRDGRRRLRLTDAGTTGRAELLETEREAWGIDDAVAALDAFLDLDHRVKDIVTAWQLRDDAGAQVVERPLGRRLRPRRCSTARRAPRRCHGLADASRPRCLAAGRLRRPARSRARRGRVGGDGRFVASPRVDSYHGIWFELHEDLIQLAGRTREDEAAAGRA